MNTRLIKLILPQRRMLAALSESEVMHHSELRGRPVYRYRVIRALESAGLLLRSGHEMAYLQRTAAGTAALGRRLQPPHY